MRSSIIFAILERGWGGGRGLGEGRLGWDLEVGWLSGLEGGSLGVLEGYMSAI